jgi:hypothetical protein
VTAAGVTAAGVTAGGVAPAPLGDLLASPGFFDVLIAAVVAEGVALVLYRRRTGRGMPAGEVASFLGSGLALMLALRAVASAAVAVPPPPGARTAFAVAMLAALVLHAWHLAQRWNS